MSFTKKAFVVLFAFGLSLFTTQATYSAEGISPLNVKTVKIHGYEVSFVNLGQGEKFAVTYEVPVGAMHDFGSMLGRQHNFEHLIFTGSEDYPGKETMFKRLEDIGYQSNANTGLVKTFYYAVGPQNHAVHAVDIFLSPLTGLLLEPQHIESEGKVVREEVTKQYLPKESMAVAQMPFIYLATKGNPYNQPFYGTQASLEQLSRKHFIENYDVNYRPGVLKITIVGNFTAGISIDSLEEQLEKRLRPRPAFSKTPQPTPFSKLAIPSLVDQNTAERRLIIDSESEQRYFTLTFDLGGFNTSILPEIVALKMLLSLETTGSFANHLIRETRLLNGVSLYAQTLNKRVIAKVFFDLTEVGYSKVDLIIGEFFRFMADSRDFPVDEISLKTIRQTILNNAVNNRQSVSDFVDDINSIDPSLPLDYARLYEALTPNKIQKVAGLFAPKRALYSAFVPLSQNSKKEFDSNFSRAYQIVPQNEQVSGWQKDFLKRHLHEAPRYVSAIRTLENLEPIPFGFKENRQMSTVALQSKDRLVLDATRRFEQNQVTVSFNFAPLTPRENIAWQIRRKAIRNLYDDVFLYLQSINVYLGSSLEDQKLTVTVRGQHPLLLNALEWYLDRLTKEPISANETALAAEQLASEAEFSDKKQMSASAAENIAIDLVMPNSLNTENYLLLLPTISVEEVDRVPSDSLFRTQLDLIMAGQFSDQDLRDLLTRVRTRTPNYYGRPVSQLLAGQNLTPGQKLQAEWSKLRERDQNFGLYRLLKGNSVNDLTAYAASIIINSLLSEKVYEINRSQKGLGYVHGSHWLVLQDRWYIGLLGQTELPEQVAETLNGWQEVITLFHERKISPEEIKTRIRSQIERLKMPSTDVESQAELYSVSLARWGNPWQRKYVIEELEKLTPEKLYALADQLFSANNPSLQVEMRPCEVILAAPKPVVARE